MNDLIVTGAFNYDIAELMFGEEIKESKTIPLGTAMYKNPIVQTDIPEQYVLFNIDNVATL